MSKVRVETILASDFEELNNLYGSILNNFGFHEENGFGFVSIISIEDIKKLDTMLSKYIDNYNGNNSKINWYFGLLFKHEDGKFILEIQDNYN